MENNNNYYCNNNCNNNNYYNNDCEEREYEENRVVFNPPDTETGYYNCGGYALGTYNWYRPYHYNEDYFMDEPIPAKHRNTVARRCAKQILEDFPNLKLITRKEMGNYTGKKIILFRVGKDDFHFRVRKDGKWSEKLGCQRIQAVNKKDLFASSWNTPCNKYTSQIFIFVEK